MVPEPRGQVKLEPRFRSPDDLQACAGVRSVGELSQDHPSLHRKTIGVSVEESGLLIEGRGVDQSADAIYCGV